MQTTLAPHPPHPYDPPATPSWAPWRLLALAGAAGLPGFLVVASLAGALTPGYDPITQPVSALAWGPLGWLQAANFTAFGLAVIASGLALCAGLPRPAGDTGRAARAAFPAAALLAVSGLSLIAAGAFPADPPGAPQTPSTLVHGLAFFGTFLPLPGAYAFAALRLQGAPGWRRHALATAALPSAVFFLFAVHGVLGSAPGDPLFPVSGLLQRILLVVGFGWLTATGVRLLARPRGARAPGSDRE